MKVFIVFMLNWFCLVGADWLEACRWLVLCTSSHSLPELVPRAIPGRSTHHAIHRLTSFVDSVRTRMQRNGNSVVVMGQEEN